MLKKLTFLGIPLTLITLTCQAETHTINFFNPTGTTMTVEVISNNNMTHIECSGYCTSLPPNGNVIYKISSNESKLPPWGNFTATFTYSESSNYCRSAIEGVTIKYGEITNYLSSADFFIKIGEVLPSGLYGSVKTTKKCAT